ncbi:Maf family protein [Candidatus Babeliales bacterium]|nr:Maf family protein [Candidatus Babeliales bacterium]
MKHILYLASGSAGRKKLLIEAQIPFELISHTADETQCDLLQPIDVVVKHLAQLKMKYVQLPVGREEQVVFVLTADTLTLNSTGKLMGKPVDRDDAVAMISDQNPTLTGTAFCLEKKEFKDGIWYTQQQIIDYDQAWCTVQIPQNALELYLSKIPYLMVSGAISIQGFGEQFVSEIRGNYSSIIGMPMYKLRDALQKMNFF